MGGTKDPQQKLIMKIKLKENKELMGNMMLILANRKMSIFYQRSIRRNYWLDRIINSWTKI
jgi:hypothetical protein